MTLPSDRGHLVTEHRHDASADLDVRAVRDCIDLIVDDHRAVTRAVSDAAEAIARLVDEIVPRMRCGGRLVYGGAGTSGRLGVLDAAECPPTFQADPAQVIGIIAGGDSALRRSSEGREDDPLGSRPALEELGLGPDDTFIGIAAGGTTPWVRGAIGLAKETVALTALITCAPEADRPDGCDHLVLLETGPELLAGSTRLKAGSATKLALNVISTTVFVQLGKVYSNLMVDLRATNTKLLDRAIRIVQMLCPDLGREDAMELLDAADRHVKSAVVMHRRGVGINEARTLLDQADGQLRSVIG